ncbi:MAG: hypothetical protein WKG07_19455 [Hymenobacter sp.]
MMPLIIRRHNGHAYCTTEYILTDGWLRTTWQGFVSAAEAQSGAQGALEALSQQSVPYLLNDNSQIQGPWFDSVSWLEQVWAPQAERMGLRYVAHVSQPHTESDLSNLLTHNPFTDRFELQVFATVEAAQDWLRDCKHRNDTAGLAGGADFGPSPSSSRAAA